jgi:hypothetical protein
MLTGGNPAFVAQFMFSPRNKKAALFCDREAAGQGGLTTNIFDRRLPGRIGFSTDAMYTILPVLFLLRRQQKKARQSRQAIWDKDLWNIKLF